MPDDTQRLIISLEARITQFEKALAKATNTANTRTRQIEQRFQKMNAGVSSSFSGLGAAMGSLGAYLSVSQVTAYANEWTRVTRALTGSQQVFGISLKSAQELNALASDARVDLDAYSKLYIRTSAAIRDYGFEAGAAETVTSTLAKALKLGGANASEQTSVLLQFSQALQKGKLDGDEFRTVMENAGVVQELLAQRLNVTKGEIVQMAAAGKLKIEDLVKAMTEGADEVDRIFRQTPQTVDEAFQVLSNAVTQYIGEADKAWGISESTAGAIGFLAQNFETAGDAAFVLSAALLAAFSPAVLARMWAFAAASSAATGPLGLMVAAAAGAAAAFAAFGDEIHPIPGQMANLHDTVEALAEVTGARLTPAWDAARVAASALAAVILGTSKDVDTAAQATETAIGRMARKVAEWHVWVLQKTGAISLASDVMQAAETNRQERIGAGFETTLIPNKTRSPSSAGATDANARLTAYQREVNEIIKKSNALEVQAQMIGRTTYETQRAAAARDLLTAAEETAKKTGTAVTVEQIADVQQLADKYAQVQAKVEYLNALQSARENIDVLLRENELIGLHGAALDAARVRQELLNAAKKAGVDANPAEIEAIAQQTAAQMELNRVISDTRDVAQDAMKSFILDLREGKSGVEALGGVLDKISDKLIDMAVNQLVENALGGLFGGSGLTSGSGAGFITTLTKGFSSGGYTGNGGRMQPAGVVHKGEFVVNASATKANRALLEAMNSGAMPGLGSLKSAPAAPGGAGNSIVTVAPVFHVQNGTPEGIEALKREMVPLIRVTVLDAFQRDRKKFGRS